MKKSLKVFAPATVANVACGFDILGFAVDAPGDEVRVTLTDGEGVKIAKMEGDEGKLSFDPTQNTAGVSVLEFLKKLDSKQGVEIELYKKLPFGSGLGSSAASSVASVFALNELMGRPYTVEQLVPFTMEAERVACGTCGLRYGSC
jgi:homoserine kinase